MYCMPRLKQGSFALANWSNGFSWYEMSGAMIAFNRQDYTALRARTIRDELARARLPTPVC
jgi:hypothetical protein